MGMDELSVIAPEVTCEGCGICCMHMAVPPYSDEEEAALPKSVRSAYRAVVRTRDLQWQVHGTDYIPCGFFDHETRRCRHYEHRPEVCRDFEVGGEYCVNMRIDAGGLLT